MKKRSQEWREKNPNATEEEIKKANDNIAEEIVKEFMKEMFNK
jgi:hypothetical protein